MYCKIFKKTFYVKSWKAVISQFSENSALINVTSLPIDPIEQSKTRNISKLLFNRQYGDVPAFEKFDV